MTADHWGFVLSAYGLAAAVFLGYWRWLIGKERDLTTLRVDREMRSHQPPRAGHPRVEPGSQHPLP